MNIPKDFAGASNANRGFAFIEFEDARDADEARFNMNGAELFGRVLRVNVARAMSHKLGSTKPVWSADEWFKNLNEGNDEPEDPAVIAARAKDAILDRRAQGIADQ